MESLARSAVRNMPTLSWGEYPEGVVRLQFGENPYVFGPARVAATAALGKMNRYPDAQKSALRRLVAARDGVTYGQVYVGNGVDGLIELVAKTYLEEGDTVLVPGPTFPCYAAATHLLGATVRTVALDENWALPRADWAAALADQPKVVWLAQPNNPTGNQLVTPTEIAQWVAEHPRTMWVVDETYFELGGETVLPLVAEGKYPNLVVFRGFSKGYGLAGLRVGLVYGDEAMIALLQKVEGSSQVFAVNQVALAAAEAVLRHPQEAAAFVREYQQAKEEYVTALTALPDVQVRPTLTSFCLFRVPMLAEEYRRGLLRRGVALKPMGIFAQRDPHLCLSAVPHPDDLPTVMGALRAELAAQGHGGS